VSWVQKRPGAIAFTLIPVLGPLEGQGLGHLAHSTLARGIEGDVGKHDLEGQGAEVDDLAFSQSAHRDRSFLAREEGALQVHRHQEVPVGFGEGIGGLADVDSRPFTRMSSRPVVLGGLAHRPPRLVRLREVGGDEVLPCARGAAPARSGLEVLAGPCTQRHVRAGVGESEGDPEPKPAAAPRDQGHSAVEPEARPSRTRRRGPPPLQGHGSKRRLQRARAPGQSESRRRSGLPEDPSRVRVEHLGRAPLLQARERETRPGSSPCSRPPAKASRCRRAPCPRSRRGAGNSAGWPSGNARDIHVDLGEAAHEEEGLLHPKRAASVGEDQVSSGKSTATSSTPLAHPPGFGPGKDRRARVDHHRQLQALRLLVERTQASSPCR
jgi:hypothetical protein